MFFVRFRKTVRYEPSGYKRLETGTLLRSSIRLSVSGHPKPVRRSAPKGSRRHGILIMIPAYCADASCSGSFNRARAGDSLWAYLAHQLYGIGLFDPIVIGGATIVLSVCAVRAGFLPACQAASIQSLQAVRSE